VKQGDASSKTDVKWPDVRRLCNSAVFEIRMSHDYRVTNKELSPETDAIPYAA
jgi:hypothetical protein